MARGGPVATGDVGIRRKVGTDEDPADTAAAAAAAIDKVSTVRDVKGDCACGLFTDRFERLLDEGGDRGARDAAFIEPVSGRDICRVACQTTLARSTPGFLSL